MKYVEAFKSLGYTIENQRQHWSAASDTGVCISIWRDEIKYAKGVSSLNTETDCEPISEWDKT